MFSSNKQGDQQHNNNCYLHTHGFNAEMNIVVLKSHVFPRVIYILYLYL